LNITLVPFTRATTTTQKAAIPRLLTSSRINSAEDLKNVPEVKELKHIDLKKAVVKRDGVCLFCWDTLECSHYCSKERQYGVQRAITLNASWPNAETSSPEWAAVVY
jgi:hypothetical protein